MKNWMNRELSEKQRHLAEYKEQAESGRKAIQRYDEYLEKTTDFQDLTDMANLTPEQMIDYLHDEIDNETAHKVRYETVDTLLRVIEFRHSETKCIGDLIRVVLDKT